jgi:two-component system phosphate regulon response regulator OmpR
MNDSEPRPTKNVVIVDDDNRLLLYLDSYLRPRGVAFQATQSRQQLFKSLSENEPDLLILDIMMPEIDGFTLLQEARANYPNLPIIMLSARGNEDDRILGLELGADDYLSKPFNPRELLARIQSVSRRRDKIIDPETDEGIEGGCDQETEEAGASLEVIQADNFILNRANLTLGRGRLSKSLTAAEFAILELLMKNAGKICRREDIIKKALGNSYYNSDRNIDVHISRLRGYIRDLGEPMTPIRTIRNTGYVWGHGTEAWA